MKIKTAAIVLICAASITLLNDVWWLLQILISESSYSHEFPRFLMNALTNFVMPAALLILGIALLTNKEDIVKKYLEQSASS
jgi:hypothetical protein